KVLGPRGFCRQRYRDMRRSPIDKGPYPSLPPVCCCSFDSPMLRGSTHSRAALFHETVALTIARMPARIASGSVGQAAITTSNPLISGLDRCAFTALYD